MKSLRLFFAAAAGAALLSCGEAMHPTSPDRDSGPTIRADAVTSEGAGGPTVATDKTDYPPGDTVTITGMGWQAYETVSLLLTEDPATHPPMQWNVSADSAGSFTDRTFVVQDHDLGVAFSLYATGAASADTAQGTFTDGTISAGTLATYPGGAASGTPATSCSGSTGTTVNAGTPICAVGSFTISDNGATGVQLRWRNAAGTVVAATQRVPDFPNGSAGAQNFAAAYTPTTTGTWTVLLCEGNNTDLTLAGCQSGRERASATFTVNAVASNVAPVLGAIGNKSIAELVELTFTATATDDGLPTPATLTYSLANPATGTFPTGATIGSTSGVFSWTPTEAQGPGTYRVKVVVSDGVLSDEEEIEITVTEVNAAPVLGAIGNKSVDELVELSFTATANDSDLPANTLTFSLGTPDVSCGYATATGAAITSAGAFTWTPTEAQGPGTYCARIQVSDGTVSDYEDIQITVAEVNVAPVLTVPTSFSTQWGVPLSGVTASATDADLPANTLTFSLVSPPTGMTINSSTGVISWTPTSAQIGANVITVRVTDNGTPSLYDETPTFTITVTTRPTKLTYNGNLVGQYSDKDSLSGTLVDDGNGTLKGTALSGMTIDFTFDGASAGSDATDANGLAYVLYTIPKPDGNYNVSASFTATGGYAGSTDTDNTFDANPEDATVSPDAANPGSVPVASPGSGLSGAFSLVFYVRETTTPSPEPDPNNGALAGNIDNAGLTLTLVPIAGGGNTSGTCAPTNNSGTDYGRIETFTCAFLDVPLGAYEVDAVVANGGSPAGAYYGGQYADALTVYDASLGFVTGGGKFILDGDKVSFGFVANVTGKGKTAPRGSLVVVRHHADGSSCRTKSNSIGAPAINLADSSATFSGKANYGCVDASGASLPGGAGNLSLTAYVKDNGEPGSGATNPDKFWVRVMGELLMSTPASANASPLTGGNIQVPHNKL